MKRFISVILVVVMILTVCATAFAADFSTPTLKKDKNYSTGKLSKTTKTGSAASVTVKDMTQDTNGTYATFHFRVWRSSTYQASNGDRITGKGSASLTSMKDDYGKFRLRQGSDYSYFLKATHSTYSKLSEAKCNGSWNP